jgi:hypothetical protein
VVAWSTYGLALDVHGPALFTTAGRLTIPAGATYGKIGMALTPRSLVLATLQTPGGGCVKAAVPDYESGSVTVYLNKAQEGDVVVAWFVIEARE